MKLSIIIPVQNGEAFLERCMDSVIRAMDLEQDEVILIDDASTDKTRDICSAYVRRNPSVIRYYRLDCLSGPSISRNVGIDYARGEYLAFIDSDDYIEPDMFRILLAEAQRTKADMVCCGYWLENEHSRRKHVCRQRIEMSAAECLKELLHDENIGNYVWNKLFKRELFDGLRFPEGEIYEDIRIMYKVIMRCSKIVALPQCMYHYIKRKGSLTYRPTDQELILQQKINKVRNDEIRQVYPDLASEVDRSTLKRDIFVYSRLAKEHTWKECETMYPELRGEIIRLKHQIRHMPMKYRILGNLIVHMPWMHGRVMYGK